MALISQITVNQQTDIIPQTVYNSLTRPQLIIVDVVGYISSSYNRSRCHDYKRLFSISKSFYHITSLISRRGAVGRASDLRSRSRGFATSRLGWAHGVKTLGKVTAGPAESNGIYRRFYDCIRSSKKSAAGNLKAIRHTCRAA